MLTGWALDGRGIVLKPIFEVAVHLRAGRLVPVAVATPPMPAQLSALTPHRRVRELLASSKPRVWRWTRCRWA